MEKTLSIIVPAYNVEAWIERCLSSFIAEDVLKEIEVLVIDDGSKDGTAAIVKSYCERYPQTFYLYSKSNGGHGSTINYGILNARGKYFKVVDGDDWVDTEELGRFVKTLKALDVDVVAADFKSVRDGTFDVIDEYYCVGSPELYGTTIDLTHTDPGQRLTMHALTFKTDLLQTCNVRLDEHCFYVDAEYITYPMPYVQTMYFHKGFLYRYRLGRDGQSMNLRSMQRNREQHKRVLNSLLAFYGSLQQDLPKPLRRYIVRCIANVVEGQFLIYISLGLHPGIRAELASFDRKLKAEHPDIWCATAKKSIALLRATHYLILPLGAIACKLFR